MVTSSLTAALTAVSFIIVSIIFGFGQPKQLTVLSKVQSREAAIEYDAC